MIALLIKFFQENTAALGIFGVVLGYLVVRFKGTQNATLKQALLIVEHTKVDAVLEQKQKDIEEQIKQASKQVEHPVLTPDEALKKLDQI